MSERAGLSEGFVYAPKPPAAPAANIRVSVPPHNKDVFNRGNETIMFNIPAGKRGQYLNTRMSYLKFELDVTLENGTATDAKLAPSVSYGDHPTVSSDELTMKAAHVLALDGGAHSLFNSLEVYHGTNLLEQIREYGALYQLMLDTSTDSVDSASHFNVSDGMMGKAQGGYRRKGQLVTPIAATHVHRDAEFAPNIYRHNAISATGLNSPQTVSGTTSSGQPLASFTGKDTTGADVTITSLEVPQTVQLNGDVSSTVADVPFAYREKLHKLHHVKDLYAASAVSAHLRGAEHHHKDAHYDHGAAVVGETVTYTFCIPLMSGLLGPQMGKYIPVGALAADLRMELGLAAFEQAFVSLGGLVRAADDADCDSYFVDGIRARQAMDTVPITRNQSFQMKNVELMLEYIEVASDVQTSIEAATGGQYVMSFESFSNFQNSIAANQGSFAQLIGAKFSSVKTVLSMFRDSAHVNRAIRHGITSRADPFNTRPNRPEMSEHGQAAVQSRPYMSGGGFYYAIGATHYPPKPIQSDQEAYYEALKSQHMVTGTPVGSIDFNNWTISARADVANESDKGSSFWNAALEGGTFFAAQNFESQSHKSALAESGVNTLSQNMYMHCRFPPRLKMFEQGLQVNGKHSEKDDIHTYLPNLSKKTLALTEAQTGRSVTDMNTITPWEQGNNQLQVDHYIHYDGILVIANGICNTRF